MSHNIPPTRGNCSCPEHGETGNSVCKQCQKLICEFCKGSEHRYHEIQSVAIVAEEIRTDIIKHNANDWEKMDSIEKGKKLITDMKTELANLQTRQIEKMNETMANFHRQLEEIHADFVKNVTETIRKDVELLNKAERSLNRTAASLSAVTDAAKRLLTEADDIEVIKVGYSVCEELQEALPEPINIPSKGQAFNVQFIPGNIDSNVIRDLFGEIISTPGGPGVHRQGQSAKSLQKSSVYYASFSRDVTINHETGILSYNTRSKDEPVGQFIGPKPLSRKCQRFSLKIEDEGSGCFIAIGICHDNYPPNHQPGWEMGSIGYHADDGGIYIGAGSPTLKAERCVKGDVMECAVDFSHNKVRFKKNGKEIFNIDISIPSRGLYPTVGLHSLGEAVVLLEDEPWTPVTNSNA